MSVITHENIIKSSEFAQRYPDIDIILFYRDLLGCRRTIKPDGFMQMCDAYKGGSPSQSTIWHLSSDGTQAIITEINQMASDCCTTCRFVPRK